MSKLEKFRLLFFGSDVFSLRILDNLLVANLCPIHVITKPGSLLDTFAAQRNLVRHEWSQIPQKIQIDSNIGIVASFGHLIKEEIVLKFNYGLFNIHPSLLPMYRGSTPVQAAILDGIKETGCTIMKIPPIPKFDIGDIILQEKLSIQPGEYAYSLRDRLADLGAELMKEVLLNYDNCMQHAKPQSQVNKSYAKKLRPEQGLLQFKSESSTCLDRKVRAYTGFIDLFTLYSNGIRIRLEDMLSPEEVEIYDLNELVLQSLASIAGAIKKSDDIEAGTIFFHKIRRVLCFKCTDQKWVAFRYATPSQKSRMTAADFYNGYLSKVDPVYRSTSI